MDRFVVTTATNLSNQPRNARLSTRNWFRRYLTGAALATAASVTAFGQSPATGPVPITDAPVATEAIAPPATPVPSSSPEFIVGNNEWVLQPVAKPATGTGDSKKPNYPSVKVTGFFQADSLWVSQDPANMVAVGNGNPVAGDVQDGADFRRARLAATGQAWDNTKYMLEMDFAFPGHPSFMDVWMEFDQVWGANKVRIGQFRQPFGMDGLTSVKELTFLERALPFAFLPFRQIGAMMYGNNQDENLTWAASAYRFPTDVYGGNVGDNGGYGMSSRVTALLIDQPDSGSIVHIGGGYSFVDPANDVFQYRNQPEVFVGETGGGVPANVPNNLPPFVDTGLIPAANANLLNAELGLARGSLHAESEFYYTIIDQLGGPSLLFPGGYAQVGYTLTGERRSYNRAAGVFGRVDPRCSVGKQGGIGAWEIAARWSHLDLTDENIRGGRINDLTLGLNWYLNPHTKFQFNYIHAMLDSPINGDSDADLFALRGQLDF